MLVETMVVGGVLVGYVEVEKVLSGQYVVVKVIVVVVPPVVQMDVPVEVTVIELELGVVVGVEVVVDSELKELVDETEVLEAVEDDWVAEGVQFGRVKDSPQLPDPHSTMQFLAQAASPLVLLVSQHSDPSLLIGKYPERSSLQFPPWPMPLVQRMMMLLWRESLAQ